MRLRLSLASLAFLSLTACGIDTSGEFRPDPNGPFADAGLHDAGHDADASHRADAEAGPDANACTPLRCDQLLGNSCGAIADGCGGTIDCGSCSAPETCGGSGTPNVCGCTPLTCEGSGKNCGTMPDGCQWTIFCGDCAGGQTCGGGGAPNVCGSAPCVPTTCAAAGKTCGAISDNCGATLACGTCSAPQYCGGAGVANVCGCTPESDATLCAHASATCGSIIATDSCGGARTAICGDCVSPETCGGAGVANACGCVAESDAVLCANRQATCGPLTTTDKCGATRTVASCGACTNPMRCGGSGVASACGIPLDGSWTWQLPQPQSDALVSVWAASPSDVWAVGSYGAIVHSDGATMRLVPSNTQANLNAVWGRSASDVWAVGAAGVTLHYDGNAWSRVPIGTSSDLGGLSGASSGDTWVIARSPADGLFHQTGGVWTRNTPPLAAGESIVATATLGPNDAFAIGASTGATASPPAFHFNGLYWQRQTINAPGVRFSKLWAVASNDVWALGYMSAKGSYLVFHWDGATWSDVTGNGFRASDLISSIWAGAGKNVWVSAFSGGQASAYHLDATGNTWTRQDMPIPVAYSLYGSTGASGALDLWTVGTYGQMAHGDGSAFTRVGEAPLRCTRGAATKAGEVWAACRDTLMHFDGQTWARVATPDATEVQSGVWVADDGVVWTTTTNGKILRLENGTWVASANYPGAVLTSITGSSAKDLWVTGQNGSLVHGDGATWTPIVTGLSVTLTRAWAESPSNVYVVGESGKMLRYDGHALATLTTPVTNASFVGVHGRAANDVWAVTSSDVIHWDGQQWRSLPATSLLIEDIWAAGDADVFVAGTSALKHWNGIDWTSLDRPTGTALHSLVALGPRDLFAVGDGIARWR